MTKDSWYWNIDLEKEKGCMLTEKVLSEHKFDCYSKVLISCNFALHSEGAQRKDIRSLNTVRCTLSFYLFNKLWWKSCNISVLQWTQQSRQARLSIMWCTAEGFYVCCQRHSNMYEENTYAKPYWQ